MEQKILHMVRGSAVCEHGHRFTIHRLPDMSYGFKDARTPDPTDLAYMNCFEDPVFDELSQIFNDLLGVTGILPLEMLDCFHMALAITCDPAPSGLLYTFSETWWCPVCKSTQVDITEAIPTIMDHIRLPHVTHNEWQKLNILEKRGLVESTLKKGGCL